MKLLTLLFLTLSTAVLAQRQPTITHLKDSANTTQYLIEVPRDYMPYGPWITIGTQTYQDWVQTMWDKDQAVYRTKMTFIYMVDSSKVKPLRVEAENYREWHGLRLSVPWVLAPPQAGIGGTAVGSWISYDVDLTTYDSIRFRQSSVNQGRKMEIRLNSVDGQLLTTYSGESTGAWETFKEVTVPLYDPGVDPIPGQVRLVFLFLEPAVMDYDWFELR
jgi:hypothetical protein